MKRNVLRAAAVFLLGAFVWWFRTSSAVGTNLNIIYPFEFWPVPWPLDLVLSMAAMALEMGLVVMALQLAGVRVTNYDAMCFWAGCVLPPYLLTGIRVAPWVELMNAVVIGATGLVVWIGCIKVGSYARSRLVSARSGQTTGMSG